jgi:glucose/arabinose dehydrogenase
MFHFSRTNFVLLRQSFLALAILAACNEDMSRPVTEPAAEGLRVRAAVNPPPGASVTVQVTVPASMQSPPFDVDRFLTIPPNFSIAVYARVSGARFIASAPNGDLLVSNPSAGAVYIVRPGSGGGDPVVTTWASGLYKPHDIVFHTIGATTYVYVAEADKIARYTYTLGDVTGQNRQVIIPVLPSAKTLGFYQHELKNIALNGSSLYVSIGSTCNVCTSDTQSDPVRASVYLYNADGTGGRLFARGLRNAEGLAVLPGTTTLWVAVNNRDDIAFPLHADWDGDGSDDYGRVMQSYIDNHPPDEFIKVRDGGNYGWPFCNPNPDSPAGLDNMPFDRDVEMNPDGTLLNCDTADRIDKGIQAHSAPLGLLFLQGTTAPSLYRDGALVPLHGSWNRSAKTGYKVIDFPWDPVAQLPGAQIDIVTGWLVGGTNWGRPVDAAVGLDGGIYISDDQSGTIYKLTYATVPASVAKFTYTCSALTCSFDASTSTGADSYSWNFGDGGKATGVTTSHSFPAGRQTYTVTLKTRPSGTESTATKSVRCNQTGCL